METLLTYLTSTTVLCAVSFVAGGYLWPKVVDKITGVPAGFRSAMNSVETKAKADVQGAIADVVSKYSPVKAPVAPAAPVVAAAPPAAPHA